MLHPPTRVAYVDLLLSSNHLSTSDLAVPEMSADLAAIGSDPLVPPPVQRGNRNLEKFGNLLWSQERLRRYHS